MVRFRISAAALLGLAFLFVVGCGPAHYQATGKLTKGGQPLKINDKAVLQMAFFAESDKSLTQPYAVTWEKDGTFKVTGRDGRGLPAGKYIASIVLIDPYPNGKDIFDGRLAKEKGPVVEVKGSGEIVIDVDKK